MLLAACSYSHVSTASRPSSPEPFVPTVTVTGAGIEPDVSHVTRGTDCCATVTFINNDSRPRVFESAPELGYGYCREIEGFGILEPGAKRAVGPFAEAGLCGFHDASDPQDRAFQGVVMVH